ncbi:MAG: undecaprenyl-phosphate glucose phosphotransferase [Flammeovirgaceae bacterium]|nr:undecaprenyl-phosphate glucose phosphotransferase [Flammeovirgaceae bacterium]
MERKFQSVNLPFFILGIVDLVLLNFSFRLAYFKQISHYFVISDYYFTLLVVFNLSWLVSALLNKVDTIEKFADPKHVVFSLVKTLFVHAFLILAYIVSFQVWDYSRLFLIFTYLFVTILTLSFRFFFTYIIKKYGNLGLKSNKVVIVGAEESGKALLNYFNTYKYFGYKFMGFFDNNPNTEGLDKSLIKGDLNKLKDYCIEEQIDEIYFTLPLTDKILINDLLKFADEQCIYFKMAPEMSLMGHKELNFKFYGNIPVMTLRKDPLGYTFNKIVKRAFDIAFSFFVISCIFPFILPIIAIAIKLESKGPIFFKQLRPGKKNRLFVCYKFRTMKVNKSDHVQATKNDARITKSGAFLRKTSLDELPQFFNVLLGDMSVVGPRPNMVNQLKTYSKLIDKYTVRHFVTPGITGYAQVNGYRGETKEIEAMEKRVEYDVKYIENWSLFLDIKIIFLTVFNIVKGEENAY